MQKRDTVVSILPCVGKKFVSKLPGGLPKLIKASVRFLQREYPVLYFFGFAFYSCPYDIMEARRNTIEMRKRIDN